LPHNTHELKHGQVGRSQPTRERVSPCSIAPNIGITIERQVREADESLYPSRDCRLRRRPKLGDGIVGREEVFEAKVMVSWPLSEGTPSGEAFVLRYKTCGRCGRADATRGDHRRRQVGGNEADPYCRRQTAISSIVQPRAAAFSNSPKIESGAALTADDIPSIQMPKNVGLQFLRGSFGLRWFVVVLAARV
jgi:hypothetical protein